MTTVMGPGVQVLRFMDGVDQRWLVRGKSLRQWRIDLTLLSEGELARLEAFFVSMQGDYETFDFPDPISGTSVSNCRFGNPELVTGYERLGSGSASLWVVECNG